MKRKNSTRRASTRFIPDNESLFADETVVLSGLQTSADQQRLEGLLQKVRRLALSLNAWHPSAICVGSDEFSLQHGAVVVDPADATEDSVHVLDVSNEKDTQEVCSPSHLPPSMRQYITGLLHSSWSGEAVVLLAHDASSSR